MKSVLPLMLVSAAFAGGVFAQNSESAPYRPYLTAAAAYGLFGDFDDAPGAVLNAGVQYKRVHSVEIELGYFDSGSPDYWVDGVEFIPMLAGYRYTADVGSKTRLFAGGLVGITRQVISIDFGSSYSQEVESSPFTYGLKGGVSHQLRPNLSVDVTGTVLRSNDSVYIDAGTFCYFSAGLSYRF